MGHHVAHWRQKGRTTRQARVQKLKARLETEQDPKIRAAIEAQIWHFAGRFSFRPPP
jgi:hypothetical protein